jgi:hypothetical protein
VVRDECYDEENVTDGDGVYVLPDLDDVSIACFRVSVFSITLRRSDEATHKVCGDSRFAAVTSRWARKALHKRAGCCRYFTIRYCDIFGQH